ncbi:MAG: cytochrome c oxidase subunit 3 family protein [Phycisphaerales bacterium]|nr:cytochrome c oxidase subunit 3 family protein [Phycisphaerales bacterium]
MTAIDANSNPPSDSPDHDHGHGGHESENPFQAHHFDTPDQQFESAKLGMWLFLGTEILFFGALFALYTILRANDPEVFSYASQYLDTILGGVNTAVLILSSLTMAMAVHFAQRSKKTLMLICLWLTLLGAIGFLVIKYFEYEHKFHVNLKWGPGFYMPVDEQEATVVGDDGTVLSVVQEDELAVAKETAKLAAEAEESLPAFVDPLIGAVPPVDATTVAPAAIGPGGISAVKPVEKIAADRAAEGHVEHSDKPHLEDQDLPVNTHRFFAIYYAMTGLHGIHVVVGIVMILWLIVKGMKGHFDRRHYAPVDLGGLYWHIVDLVWIFLFPLFYLIH